MTVILKNGAVFLHIPKTGGCWIWEVLNRYDLIQERVGHEHADWDHTLWNDRFEKDGKVFRHILRRYMGLKRAPVKVRPDAFRFCFVREPLKWYESYWRFMQGLNWQAWGDEFDACKWHPKAMLNGLGSPDFNTFVANVNKKRAGYVTEMYGWYVRPGTGFVGKQESLQEDMCKVLRRMDPAIDVSKVATVGKINETSSEIPKPEWDPKLKKETFLLEYASYVRFGYPIDEKLLS